MPSLRLTLILPPAQLLAAMDVKVLLNNLAFIRQNYTSVNSRTCDLRRLPEVYPDLH